MTIAYPKNSSGAQQRPPNYNPSSEAYGPLLTNSSLRAPRMGEAAQWKSVRALHRRPGPEQLRILPASRGARKESATHAPAGAMSAGSRGAAATMLL